MSKEAEGSKEEPGEQSNKHSGAKKDGAARKQRKARKDGGKQGGIVLGTIRRPLWRRRSERRRWPHPPDPPPWPAQVTTAPAPGTGHTLLGRAQTAV